MGVVPIDGVVMRYAWGRNDLIASLQGRPVPSATPEAELWFGAHQHGASALRDAPIGETLAALIARDPNGMLGADTVRRFGPILPFLVKVLAVNEPLSLQLHPDEACVAALTQNGHHGVLADRFPKPEMIVAVGELRAFCGFLSQTAAHNYLAELLHLAPSGTWRDVTSLVDTASVNAAAATVMRAEQATITALLDDLRAALAGGWEPPHAAPLADLLRRYPTDRAVAIAVLMRHVVLHDGDALFIPPGVLHCYLAGAGVEIMASSDNVFRVGLTAKPQHPELVAELVETLQVEPVLVTPERDGAHTRYPADTEWFAVRRLRVTPGGVDVPDVTNGPAVLLTLLGDVQIDDAAGNTAALPSGTAAFLPAGTTGVQLHGDADVFVAQLGV